MENQKRAICDFGEKKEGKQLKMHRGNQKAGPW